MADSSFFHLCLFQVMDGLREGLSHYSQTSRVALIYALGPDEPLRVCDPQDLLAGHEPKLASLYGDDAWRAKAPDPAEMREFHPAPGMDPHLSGLIAFSAWSNALFFQQWFTEHHVDMCSTGPTQSWMEHAAWLMAQNMATGNEQYIEMSGQVLQQWTPHAVRNYIVDRRSELMGMDTHLRIYPTLDTVMGVSKTKEEGAWPRGQIVFAEPASIATDLAPRMLTKFPEHERPSTSNHKHVRKLLLAVEGSQRRLVSNGKQILGVATGRPPRNSLVAEFLGSHGYLRLNEELICSFSDGSFQSTTRRANLVQLEEGLIEAKVDGTQGSLLFNIVATIVNSAQHERHGCTIVVDLDEEPVSIAGQTLEAPLELTRPQHIDLARALARMDGALHLGRDLKLHGFACLLDGRATPGENRARGARFNSALRFTAEHPNILVVVVSADRPVSIIQHGVELTAQCHLPPVSCCSISPPAMEVWSRQSK